MKPYDRNSSLLDESFRRREDDQQERLCRSTRWLTSAHESEMFGSKKHTNVCLFPSLCRIRTDHLHLQLDRSRLLHQELLTWSVLEGGFCLAILTLSSLVWHSLGRSLARYQYNYPFFPLWWPPPTTTTSPSKNFPTRRDRTRLMECSCHNHSYASFYGLPPCRSLTAMIFCADLPARSASATIAIAPKIMHTGNIFFVDLA